MTTFNENFKYLKQVGPNVSYLSDKVVPEVRAMFAAMMSRAPKGGIKERYRQVVNAIANKFWEEIRENNSNDLLPEWEDVCKNPKGFAYLETFSRAEDRLIQYPIHPIVQRFFDKFVKNYGHGSIKELTGSPVVFIEDVSWWFAYLTFDNPLVSGQETSTRAVMHYSSMASDVPQEYSSKFQQLHDWGMRLTREDIEFWKNEFHGNPDKYPWIKDPQAFRPAFDRARWALPGTVRCGVAHTANIRTMSRVLQVMQRIAVLSNSLEARSIIAQVVRAYEEALPALAGMWSSEAVGGEIAELPVHLPVGLPAYSGGTLGVLPSYSLRVTGDSWKKEMLAKVLALRTEHKNYIDPAFNRLIVEVSFSCSLACARDWHRHRPVMPWCLRIKANGRPHAPYGLRPGDSTLEDRPEVLAYFEECHALYQRLLAEGKAWQAMLALPLGTTCDMYGGGGAQHVLYMLELRKHAPGANFEYKEIATQLLDQLNRLPL